MYQIELVKSQIKSEIIAKKKSYETVFWFCIELFDLEFLFLHQSHLLMNKKKGNKSLISLMNMSHAISVTSCVIFTHTFNYCVSFLYLSLSLARDIFCLIVYIWYLIVHLLANFLLAICICAQCAHTHVHTLIQYFIVYNTMPKKIVNEFSKFASIRLFLFDFIRTFQPPFGV